VDNLHKMLKLAVIEQDEDAIAISDRDNSNWWSYLCSSCYCSERRRLSWSIDDLIRSSMRYTILLGIK
jgi:hypothetical protein